LGLSEDSFLPLYKTLVQPILEYGNLIGGPNYKEDICKLEKFQQKAARMVNSTWHFEYEERLIYFLNNYPYQRRHAEVI